MPTYEYDCTACGHQWEQEQRIVEPALDTCPACHQKTARRLVSGTNFILKGGGWYADLYSKPSSKKADGGVESKSNGKADSASASSSSSSASTTSKPQPAPSGPASS